MRPVFEMSIKTQPRYIDTDEDDQEQFADLPRQEDDEDCDEDGDFEREDIEEEEEEEEDGYDAEEGFNTYASEIRDRLEYLDE